MTCMSTAPVTADNLSNALDAVLAVARAQGLDQSGLAQRAGTLLAQPPTLEQMRKSFEALEALVEQELAARQFAAIRFPPGL